MPTSRSTRPFVLATALLAGAGCSLGPDTPPPVDRFPSRGVVSGVIRDPEGRNVSGVQVSLLAWFQSWGGSPVIVANQGSTNASGRYLIELGVTFEVDVRATLTVRANPPATSGLLYREIRELEVLITTARPSAETTYVDLILPRGS